MCVSTGPADLAQTKIACMFAHHPANGRRVAVTMYANAAQSDGPCAMVLPVRSSRPLTAENFIDTTGWGARYLDALVQKGRPASRGGFGISKGVAQIFASGVYTVVSAARMANIFEALKDVPDRVRPTSVSQELTEFMDSSYPQGEFVFIVACFNARQLTPADPICYYHDAEGYQGLFFPMIDAHDGGAPQNGRVHRDHDLVIGHDATRGRFEMRHDSSASIVPAAYAWIMPSGVRTVSCKYSMPNGDAYVNPHRADAGIDITFPGM